MKAATRLLVLAAALLTLGSSARAAIGAAELGEQLDRVEREFERTRALLERVGPMVREGNAPRPREIFARALELQAQGRVQLNRARENSDRPLFASELARKALGMTLQARELAQRAGAMLREGVGFEERATRAIQELERRIDRVRERDLSADSRDAALLAEAIEQLESARKHYSDHNFEVAFRIADAATRLLDGLVGPGGNAGGAARLREQLQRTQELFDRVRERRDGFDQEALSDLERAGNLLDDARAALGANDGRRTRRLVQEAQRILRQLVERRGPTSADVERALSRVDAAIQRMQDRRSELPAEAIELFEDALEERAAARAAFDARDHDRALTHLRAAIDLLDRARRVGGPD